ncbi:ABC transporter substrate-binding protein [Nitriliruptoraceae bacterium ZYF776]|nr:ABC transporter substrate-binding protein [Profundirhabdus halotolerans]
MRLGRRCRESQTVGFGALRSERRGRAKMRLGHRARTGLVAVVASALFLVSCAGEDTSSDASATGGDGAGDSAADDDEGVGGDPIRIGLLVPTGGVYATIGEAMINGFELYLEENDATLAGRPVELVVEDTEADPEVGVRVANKLVQEDQVDFAAGVVSSAVALAVAPIFDQAETPLVIANAIGTVVTSSDNRLPHVFRVSTSGYQLTDPVGQWVYDNVTEGPVFSSVPDYAAGADFAQSFIASFEAVGGTIGGSQTPPFPNTQDFQPYLSEIRNSGAEAVFAFYAGALGVDFITQYEQFGLKEDIPLIAALATVTEDVLPAQGDAAEGVYYTTPWVAALDNPRNKEFVESYREMTGNDPMYVAPMSYDAAQLIAAALEATGGDVSDSQALIAAMEGAVLDSPRGEVEIDAETHGTVQNIYVVQLQDVDGELQAVVIEDLGRHGEQPN